MRAFYSLDTQRQRLLLVQGVQEDPPGGARLAKRISLKDVSALAGLHWAPAMYTHLTMAIHRKLGGNIKLLPSRTLFGQEGALLPPPLPLRM